MNEFHYSCITWHTPCCHESIQVYLPPMSFPQDPKIQMLMWQIKLYHHCADWDLTPDAYF